MRLKNVGILVIAFTLAGIYIKYPTRENQLTTIDFSERIESPLMAKVSRIDSAPARKILPSRAPQKSKPIPAIQKPNEIPEDATNWSELSMQWHDSIREYLLNADEENGERLYQSFLMEKEIFVKNMNELVVERSQIEYYNSSEDRVVVKDKKRLKDLSERMDVVENEYQERLKKIFGDHYESIKDLNDDFNHSIQYSSDSNTPIGVAF